MADTYNADEVNKKIEEAKKELMEYINSLIDLQEKNEEDNTNPELLLKEEEVE